MRDTTVIARNAARQMTECRKSPEYRWSEQAQTVSHSVERRVRQKVKRKEKSVNDSMSLITNEMHNLFSKLILC